MLRTIAAGLIVTALVAGPAAAQTSGSMRATATTMTKPAASNTKATSKPKLTNTAKAVKSPGKPVAQHKLRRRVVYRGGRQHLIGRSRTQDLHRHPAARLTDQRIRSNGADKASKLAFKAAGKDNAQK